MSKHNSRHPCFSFCPTTTTSSFLTSVMVVVFDTSICCCSWYSIILDWNLCSQQYNLFVGNTDIIHFFEDFLMFVFRGFCYYRSSWWLCLAIFCQERKYNIDNFRDMYGHKNVSFVSLMNTCQNEVCIVVLPHHSTFFHMCCLFTNLAEYLSLPK